MEQDIMASESPSERRPNEEREQGNNFHSTTPLTPLSQQNGPSPFNDGPELIRDNNC
jgi:hypothetical protein